MNVRTLLPLLLVTVLLSACGAESASPAVESAPELSSTESVLEIPATEEIIVVEPVVSDCLNGEISLIGESIADEYETASYEQVVSWFCDGAEFEDILVALETESQTGTSTEEMLQMLADGFSWDEIWQLVGLTD